MAEPLPDESPTLETVAQSSPAEPVATTGEEKGTALDASAQSISPQTRTQTTPPPASSTKPRLPGKGPAAGRLGDYQLLGELGRGGMGVVYEAVHLQRGNRVALKTLPVLTGAGRGSTHPSCHARSMMARSSDLMPTGSSMMRSTHASSQGAGQMRPVNSGKLLVECKVSIALFQSCL